jgi:aryl-alcohol dehydrogenase-like predicted oxidoreductase
MFVLLFICTLGNRNFLGHRFDPNTPIEETMQALHDIVQAGYARYIGMSSCHAYQCASLTLDFVVSHSLYLLTVHIMQSKLPTEPGGK